jgi:hypothetical protein
MNEMMSDKEALEAIDIIITYGEKLLEFGKKNIGKPNPNGDIFSEDFYDILTECLPHVMENCPKQKTMLLTGQPIDPIMRSSLILIAQACRNAVVGLLVE